MEKNYKKISLLLSILVFITVSARAQEKTIRVQNETKSLETVKTTDSQQSEPVLTDDESQKKIIASEFQERSIGDADDVRYTLGPNDVIEINVMRHPEFSGIFPINSEGKIQYEFVGDVDVNGLTKKQVEAKITKLISIYVVEPKVNVKITEYRSKAIYVIGAVARPGKYYMKSENIPVREAVVEAGLPSSAAAMHKSRLITPNRNEDAKTQIVDLYSILYNGNLKHNLDMHPGDQLYVPSAEEELANIQEKKVAKIEDSQAISNLNQPEKETNNATEEIRYTLGPDDVIEITVQRHPEFSGTFPVNLEGKIQYEFVGDIDVTGLTKKELEAKIKQLISGYVVNSEVTVTILEYRSKVIYVLGEVGRPGKYFMRSETIPVREAIVEAGLPLISAAMRKCRLITPDKNGKVKTKSVDLYAILYGGNLQYNIDMHPGDVFYVPSTVMAKVFRVIAPITEPVTSAAEAQTGVTTLNTRPGNTRPRAR